MTQEDFETLEKGDNVRHKSGELGIFDSRMMFPDTATVVTEAGIIQLWTAGEVTLHSKARA